MLEAGAAAGAGRDVMFFRVIKELLLQQLVQLLEVFWMRRNLVFWGILSDVVVMLGGLSHPLTALKSRSNVVVVVKMMVLLLLGGAIGLTFIMHVVMMHTVAIGVPVKVTVIMEGAFMELVVMVAGFITHCFLWVQWGLFSLGCSTVLPHLINKEDF